MTYYDILRDLHVGIGTVALGSFWVVAVLRKGTQLHRGVGNIYLLAMLGILVTATPMALVAFAHGKPVLGSFLLYLALITGTGAWTARRAIRHRHSVVRYLALPYRPLAWLNVAAGAAVLLLGISSGDLLLEGMSAIGPLIGYRMLAFEVASARDRNWWLARHYTGIIGSGAAAHIAFLNLGFRHLVSVEDFAAIRYLAWFGPVLASTVVVIYLNRRYRPVARARSAAAPKESPASHGGTTAPP